MLMHLYGYLVPLLVKKHFLPVFAGSFLKTQLFCGDSLARAHNFI